MRSLFIGMLLLALSPVALAQYPDPWGMRNLERELQDSYSRQERGRYEQEQQRQRQGYEQERQEQQTRQRNYQQEQQQEQQRYEQERKQAADDAVRRERAIQSERRGEPAPGREIYRFGR